MNKYIIFSGFIFFSVLTFGQGNCNLYEGKCKESCELANEAGKGQGSRKSQELFDKCIELCPTYAYAYFEKSVPYLKQGQFKEWKELIDKAVMYDPSYLLNRGCNQIQFIRNYEQGVQDLDSMVSLRKTIEIGFSPSGEYHAQMLRAISYQKLGDVDKAIELCEELVNSNNYNQSPFDYFHIGIIHLEAENFNKAERALVKQNKYDEKAENYFYLSKVFEQKGEFSKQRELLEKSKEVYLEGKIMTTNYYHYIDKIFLTDIESELLKLNK